VPPEWDPKSVADFDHDGFADLFFLGQSGAMNLVRGTASGALANPMTIFSPASGSVNDAMAADIDGDQLFEIVISTFSPAEIVVSSLRTGSSSPDLDSP
jgi:hypothetical protein